jgi:apolipoprotein N-acyltransferase
MASLIWFRILGAAAVGLLAWRGEFWAIPLSVVAPCLIVTQPTRALSGVAALGYYAAASFPVMAVSKAYWPSPNALPVALWLTATVILSLPWFLCWTSRASLLPCATAAAMVASAIPPLCIVGWASPLAAAGVLFPATAWLGLLAVLVLPGFLIHEGTRVMATLTAVATSLALNAQTKPLPIPNGWEGEATHIQRQAYRGDLTDLNIEEGLQRRVVRSRADFLVFPETAVRRWTEATEAFWMPTISGAGKTVLIGAVQPIHGSSRYHNSVIIFGKNARGAVHQRIPVPGGMWNPFRRNGGVAMDLFGAGTVEVGGQRAAILICYEQLLVWPMLRSAVERPTVLLAASNEAWTAGTAVPRVQGACARSWARLFGLPLISAINS